MEQNAQARLEYLFDRCMKQQATGEEVAELHMLLQQPEHEALARKLIMEAHEREPGLALPETTISSITRAIFQAEEDAQTAAPRRRIHRLRYAAAAAVILLAGAGLYSWLQQSPEKDAALRPAVAVNNDPAAASNTGKPVLTLANGRTVVLDSLNSGRLAQQGGTDIVQLSGGKLAYKVNSTTNDVYYNRITTPHGCQFSVTLPDGSQVLLNALSSLRFPTAFRNGERNVELTGEAYFEIAPDSRQPFRVNVNDMEIAVLGTQFNVMAYTDEKQIQTTLLEGAVKVTGGGHSQVLQPGQQASLSKDGSLELDRSPDIESAIAWKNGYFSFKRANLQSVMRQLSRWYNIDVVYEGAIPEFRFVGQLKKNATLEANLRILGYSEVKFRTEGRMVIVSAAGN